MAETSVARSVRLVLSFAVVALLVTAASGARESRAPQYRAGECSGPSLSAAFTGALLVSDVASYACEDDWAYLWATVGSGAHAVGVTEVLHFDVTRDVWRVSSRLKVCSPRVLPTLIYRQGCFSN